VSTGGCGISLDRDSVSKEFQSRIVLGKKGILTYISTSRQSSKGDRDPNNESALKADPNHQCLGYSHTSSHCFCKDLKTVINPSIGKGWPTKLIEEARSRSGLRVVSPYEACSSTLNHIILAC